MLAQQWTAKRAGKSIRSKTGSLRTILQGDAKAAQGGDIRKIRNALSTNHGWQSCHEGHANAVPSGDFRVLAVLALAGATSFMIPDSRTFVSVAGAEMIIQ